MICFGMVLQKVIHAPGFLKNFGFHHESLFVSLVIFVRAWLVSFDPLLRVGLNWWSRKRETEADLFAATLGYGRKLQEALILDYVKD